MHKPFANQIKIATPFRTTQTLKNTTMADALQNRSFVQAFLLRIPF